MQRFTVFVSEPRPMIDYRRPLIILLFFAFLSLPALSEDWFDNSDGLTDLARFAPSDCTVFVAGDLSRTISSEEIARLFKSIVAKVGGPRAVAEMEREIGDVDEVSQVFGTRMALAFRNLQREKPDLIYAWEVKQPERAVQVLKSTGLIPERPTDKIVRAGDVSFEFIGPAGFGVYQDYLIISTSPDLLKSTLDQGWSLSHNSTFQQRVKRLNVDQGLLVYAKPPADIPAAYAQLESLHYLLAGLDISDSGFLTQAYASLDKDGSLTRALLSEPGTLSGDAARYIPKDWGFMASFHLGYVQRFISQLQKDEPGLAAPLVEAREEFESQIGVELGELLRVLEGEVSISSNGLRHAPLYYLGVDPTIDYKLTVTMPLKDPRAAQSLLKAAWSRLELDSEKLPDGAVLVSAAQLSYIVEQRLLIISYGPNSLKTLRECLVLRKGESLLSHPGVAGHYPLKSAVGSAYINLRPMIEELRHFDELGLVESLLFLDSDAIVEGTTELTVRSDGLMLEGTGGMPLFAGTGAAGAYLLFGIAPNSEASEVEIER